MFGVERALRKLQQYPLRGMEAVLKSVEHLDAILGAQCVSHFSHFQP